MDPGLTLIVNVIGQLFQAGISLAQRLGQRDAFISAMDATLGVVRAQTDRDLAEKHRDPG